MKIKGDGRCYISAKVMCLLGSSYMESDDLTPPTERYIYIYIPAEILDGTVFRPATMRVWRSQRKRTNAIRIPSERPRSGIGWNKDV
jgi:hypothetical protein